MDKQTQNNLLRIVEKNYREIADGFNETRKKYLWPELVNLSADIKDGDRVLDVGCGNGRLLEAIKEKKIAYFGVDASQELVALAQQRFDGDTGGQGASYMFSTGNILELSKLPQFNFDYVFCIAVLHHLPGENLQIEALKQLKNKVKDGGKIVLTVWNLWSQKKYVKMILKFWLLKFVGKNKMDLGDILFDWKDTGGERISQRYYHAFRGGEMKGIIKKAGLKIERKYRDKHNFYLVLRKQKS